MYKLTSFGVLRLVDNMSIIGPDYQNPDWLEYESWVLEGNEPLPLIGLEERRISKLRELSDACDSVILAGFSSTATGTTHWYDADVVDQINLIGATLLSQNLPYKCTNVETGEKHWEMHTTEQMRKVFEDGAAYRMQILQKYSTLRGLTLSATSLEDLDRIVWE